MKVMLADIESAAADAAAVAELRQAGPDVHGVVCDVADAASVERAAKASFEAFGNVHVVCNNAGVAGGSRHRRHRGSMYWRWGPRRQRRWASCTAFAHSCRTSAPTAKAGISSTRRRSQGLEAGLRLSPYATSEYAVVAMSEGLAKQVGPLGIGVTVVCPGYVRTRIGESSRNRPERYGPARRPDPNSTAESWRLRRPVSSKPGSSPPRLPSELWRRSARADSTSSPIRRCVTASMRASRHHRCARQGLRALVELQLSSRSSRERPRGPSRPRGRGL